MSPRGPRGWARVWPWLRPDLPLYLAALLAAPASAGLTILQPWLLKKAIDDAITPGRPELLAPLALGYLGAVLAAFALESGYTVALSYGATRSITRLREEVFGHALALGQRFHDREPTGRLLTRVTSDVEALGETLSAGAVTLLLDALVVVGVLGAMLALDARLTAVLMLVAPPLALTVEWIRRRMRVVFVTVRNTLSELNAYTAEQFAGLEVVQLYGDEARSTAGFDRRLGAYRDATVASNVWDALMFAVVDGVGAIGTALVLAFAAWAVGGPDPVTVGLLAAFVDYVGRLFNPIRELSGKLAILQRAGAALEKLVELMDTDERVADGDQDLPAAPGAVVLDGVGFGYRPDSPVLHGVSLTIAPGEVVALVGRTGSGKTTIGKLLTRSYDGYTGAIRVDGVELSRVRLDALHRRIGIVQQDVVVFPETVRFNLTLGRDLPDARLAEAVTLAQADAVVARLGGLDGRIEAGGRNLSVGEAQLLSCARTLAHDAPLVVLDEATASVDTATEARIRDATRALFERKTVLVVAHRLSTVVGADRIVVLDRGRVVESGPHEALLARGGAYAALFHAQFEAEGARAG